MKRIPMQVVFKDRSRKIMEVKAENYIQALDVLFEQYPEAYEIKEYDAKLEALLARVAGHCSLRVLGGEK